MLAACSSGSEHRPKPAFIMVNPCLNPTDKYSTVVSKQIFNDTAGKESSIAIATVTHVPEGAITAAHAVQGMQSPFKLITEYDLAYTLRKPVIRPAVKKGQTLTLVGFPAGCEKPTIRTGVVYHQRRKHEFILLFAEGTLPAFEGMSGGAVLNAAGDVVAIAITQNYPLDRDRDGVMEHSADIIELNGVLPVDPLATP